LFDAPPLPDVAIPDGVLPLTGLDQAFAAFVQTTQPSGDARHALLAALTSHQYGRGHACLDLAQLEEGVAVLGWDGRLQALLPAELGQAACTLPWAVGEGSPLVLDGTRLYLRRNWQAEQSIRAAIQARLQQPCAVPDNLAQVLDQLFPRPAAAALDAAPSTQAPDWQKVTCALAARSQFTLVTGGPGTGKTTTVVRLLALLQHAVQGGPTQAQPGLPEPALRVALAAPTGKAAARLGESIASAIAQLPKALRPSHVAPAVTLHKLLAIRPDQADAPPPGLAVDLVIVDEASMIDLDMMARLLAAVPVTARLILLGDKDQLASVEAGAVMAQLCEGCEAGHYSADTVSWLRAVADVDVQAWADRASDRGTTAPSGPSASALAQQTAMLRVSRRFRADSGIGIWARAVNAGDQAAVRVLLRQAQAWSPQRVDSVDWLQPTTPHDAQLSLLVRQGWQTWTAQLHALLAEQAALCSDEQAASLLQSFAAFQVLCSLREGPWGVETQNLRIANALGFPTEGWYAGRPVMVTRNDYNLSLMNGDVGLCLPHSKGLRVAVADGQGGIRWVNPARLDAVESVFAMTVHKSQGSEFAHVCLVLPNKPMPVLTRELLYTGITRAKTRLTLVLPEREVLWRAVQARVIRSGGLATLNETVTENR
jgi:exodeoxyribonuclease V alpha subunit